MDGVYSNPVWGKIKRGRFRHARDREFRSQVCDGALLAEQTANRRNVHNRSIVCFAHRREDRLHPKKYTDLVDIHHFSVFIFRHFLRGKLLDRGHRLLQLPLCHLIYPSIIPPFITILLIVNLSVDLYKYALLGNIVWKKILMNTNV